MYWGLQNNKKNKFYKTHFKLMGSFIGLAAIILTVIL